jgi:hypothetical protein
VFVIGSGLILIIHFLLQGKEGRMLGIYLPVELVPVQLSAMLLARDIFPSSNNIYLTRKMTVCQL